MSEDYLFMEEFTAYRTAEVEKGTTILRQVMNGKESADYLRGAMHMLKAIVNLPGDLAQTKEAKDRAQILRDRMLAEVEGKLMRKSLIEEEEG